MKFVEKLTPPDRLLAARLKGFLPAEVYDIHVHPYHPAHFGPEAWAPLRASGRVRGCAQHRAALRRYMPVQTIHGLYFGMPHRTADRPAINAWVADEVRRHGTPLSRGLMLVSPQDDRAAVAAALRSGQFCGLKVYH
jgi:glutamate-1-semialdehyde 2,1-aminomutase